MQFSPTAESSFVSRVVAFASSRMESYLRIPFPTLPSVLQGNGACSVSRSTHFEVNGYVYVYYTATTPTVHNRISRFTANGDVAVTGSEVIIFDLDNLSSATNHNGGALGFGADGKLYAAVGENANPTNAQSLANLHGKILRINKDGSIPTDNPFYTAATGKNRAIWALGLRNPFTFAFHPSDGRLFINDVGGGAAEEINEGVAGANYGWPETEGYTSDLPLPNSTSCIQSFQRLRDHRRSLCIRRPMRSTV